MKFRHRNIVCSKDEHLNVLEYGNRFYTILPLSSDHVNSKGGNSNVFKLYDPNEDFYYIIKFCKFPLGMRGSWVGQRHSRFRNEIDALKLAKKNGCDYIVDYCFDGVLRIGGSEFLYVVMEMGEMDLTQFLAQEISIQQKVLLISEIVKGLIELHDLGIYHRDIKPDNFFIIQGVCKVGDLGLIAKRDEEQSVDIVKEKIGPFGWLSPEAMNKVLCEGTSWGSKHDCKIDQKSDVFQLGKLIWFILQSNIPIGGVTRGDLLEGDENIYRLITKMLRHSKSKRPSIKSVNNRLRASYSRYGL